jgi:hypothetical protein
VDNLESPVINTALFWTVLKMLRILDSLISPIRNEVLLMVREYS